MRYVTISENGHFCITTSMFPDKSVTILVTWHLHHKSQTTSSYAVLFPLSNKGIFSAIWISHFLLWKDPRRRKVGFQQLIWHVNLTRRLHLVCLPLVSCDQATCFLTGTGLSARWCQCLSLHGNLSVCLPLEVIGTLTVNAAEWPLVHTHASEKAMRLCKRDATEQNPSLQNLYIQASICVCVCVCVFTLVSSITHYQCTARLPLLRHNDSHLKQQTRELFVFFISICQIMSLFVEC